MRSNQLRGHLDGLILAVLSERPAHGYEVIEQLGIRSGGMFELPEGTVYPALYRLEAAGLLSSTREQVSGRERRVYRATRKGRASLTERRADWSVFASTVTSILGSPA
jgi:DNA-binding PadR family transcriptional regulator